MQKLNSKNGIIKFKSGEIEFQADLSQTQIVASKDESNPKSFIILEKIMSKRGDRVSYNRVLAVYEQSQKEIFVWDKSLRKNTKSETVVIDSVETEILIPDNEEARLLLIGGKTLSETRGEIFIYNYQPPAGEISVA